MAIKEVVEDENIRNVFQMQDEDAVATGMFCVVGAHRHRSGEYTLNLFNHAEGLGGFIVVPRAVMVELRDALNRELAS